MKNVDFSLLDDFEFIGKWWLPNFPDNKVVGRIRYNAHDSIRLELIGNFDQIDNDSPDDPEVILGISTEGYWFTLVDNLFLGPPGGYPEFQSQYFESRYFLIGHHFSRKSELLFSSFAVSYDHLEEWYGHNLFNVDLIKNADFFAGYNVKFERPQPQDIPLPSREGVLNISFAFDNAEKRNRSFAINTEAFVVFKPSQPQDLDWYKRLFFDIERFLIFAFTDVTFPRRIQGYLDIDTLSRKRVDIFRIHEKRPNKNIYRWEMLFTYSQIDSRFPVILNRWLESIDRVGPVYDLFFSYLYKPDNYLEFRFLALTQALESFHRFIKGGKYLSDEEYLEYRQHMEKHLPDKISGGWRLSFKTKLKYANEYSLSKRLKELFSGIDQPVKKLITSNQSSFITNIINTRNYFTHYDTNLKQMSLSYQEMILACKQMQILLTILLLKQLEFDSQTIFEFISKNKKLKL